MATITRDPERVNVASPLRKRVTTKSAPKVQAKEKATPPALEQPSIDSDERSRMLGAKQKGGLPTAKPSGVGAPANMPTPMGFVSQFTFPGLQSPPPRMPAGAEEPVPLTLAMASQAVISLWGDPLGRSF